MSESKERDRPVAYVETAMYDVRVWGKEADDLEDVLEALDVACDRAMEDCREAEKYNGDRGLGAA